MRILFLAEDGVGDCVLSTGVLGWMVDSLPRARFTIVCGPDAASLFEGVPRLERLIPLPRRDWGLHWWDLWWQVSGSYWSTLVDLRGSLLGQGIAARRRLVLRGAGFGAMHRVVHYAGLLKRQPPPDPRAFLTDAQQEAAFALVPGEGAVLALAPGASDPRRRWPADRFAALAAHLTGPGGPLPGARVMAVGRSDEAELAAAALVGVPEDRRIDLAGRVDAGTAQACLARADLFIGNDCGAMHMAAAAGIPTLGLFGPTREDRGGPWGNHCSSIRTPESFRELADSRSGRHPMESLTLDAVAAEAASFLEALRSD